ncbi:MAG: alpha/beta hydrolase [Bacteroidia bacterium]|nr:alpha/beta hydrolase [Bacteroidia bacterium]
MSKKVGGKHAFLLFCYPFPIKLKPRQAAFLHSAEHFTIDFENKKIAGYKWGSGPQKVLCLHGWQSQSYRWKKYIESLPSDTHTIYSIDAPGHGNSEGRIFNVPMYARLIEQCLHEKDIDYVLAHSLGAFSAMSLFHEKPQLSPSKMAVLGTPGEATEFVDFFMSELKLKPRVRRNFISYFNNYAGHGPEFYSIEKFAKGQKAEGLIIHDEKDLEAPYHYAQKIDMLWPNSRLMTTSGLGHKLRGIEVVDEVVKFFG